MIKANELYLQEGIYYGATVLHTCYKVDFDKKEEYYITYVETDENETVEIMSSRRELFSGWMRMLDFNLYEDDQETNFYLTTLIEVIRLYMGKTELFIVNNDKGFLEISNKKLMKSVSRLMNDIPFIQMFLGSVFDMLNCNIGEKSQDFTDCISIGNKIINTIESLTNNLEKQRLYIEESIIVPIKEKIVINPERLILNYEMYLNALDEKSVFASSFFNNQKHREKRIKKFQFFDKNGELFPREIKDDYSYNDMFVNGLFYLINSELVLKKCKLCGRYFLNKYSYVANYCNVQYKDTNYICQEFVSKEKYKKRIIQNPINFEYSKAYNRAYSRVRRGNRSKREAHFDDMKLFRNEYIKLYDFAKSEQEKEEVLNEFIKRMNFLSMSNAERLGIK